MPYRHSHKPRETTAAPHRVTLRDRWKAFRAFLWKHIGLVGAFGGANAGFLFCYLLRMAPNRSISLFVLMFIFCGLCSFVVGGICTGIKEEHKKDQERQARRGRALYLVNGHELDLTEEETLQYLMDRWLNTFPVELVRHANEQRRFNRLFRD
jgi:hypothetical protein